jgi:hypothetical protein
LGFAGHGDTCLCNPSTQEAEAEDREFEARLGYVVDPVFKKKVRPTLTALLRIRNRLSFSSSLSLSLSFSLPL